MKKSAAKIFEGIARKSQASTVITEGAWLKPGDIGVSIFKEIGQQQTFLHVKYMLDMGPKSGLPKELAAAQDAGKVVNKVANDLKRAGYAANAHIFSDLPFDMNMASTIQLADVAIVGGDSWTSNTVRAILEKYNIKILND